VESAALTATDAYQPPLHTLTNWLITRLWLSPTAVAVAQIVALALALCLVLWGCARLGAPARIRWTTAIWLALVPANGFLTVTLWKDVPYTVAHALLVALSLRLVVEQGEALGRMRFLVALVATLGAVALYRHNGAPVVAGYLVWLVSVVGHSERRRAIGVAVATVLAIVRAAIRVAEPRTALVVHAAHAPECAADHVGPAMHGAIVLACALIAAVRLGARMTLPFVPAVLHTLVLFVVLPSNEFRLQYPVYVVGILAPLR
jgi:hypothetical protein